MRSVDSIPFRWRILNISAMSITLSSNRLVTTIHRLVSTKLKRHLTNSFIFAFLALMFIDTYPGPGSTWKRLQDGIDPLLDFTGLWQGPWDLFAPDVDRQNHHIEVVAIHRDGNRTVWRSPVWQDLSCLQTFVRIREVEFYDRIRQEWNSPAWPAFADYARRKLLPAAATESAMVEIELVEVVRPLADLRLPAHPTPPPSRRVFYQHPLTP